MKYVALKHKIISERKNPMKVKQIAAGLLAAAVMLDGYAPLALTNAAAEPASSPVFNSEGLWLTEIYQNDVDRSKKNDKRAASGYSAIRTYTSTTDLMEFIEVTSTHEQPIKLNDLYEIYYGDTPLTVTDMSGNSDIQINKGQAVVLWNYRSDVTSAIPTEAEFREEMRVPDDAVVLKIECGVNWGVTSTFTIKSKTDGKVVSTFTATDKVDTMDGFSVTLKVPDIGSDMQVYREMNLPSAGYVYSAQLNGQVQANVPDEEYAKGVYLTEVRPNDVSRSTAYGTADDYMECIEVINTTDGTVDLNKDYSIVYGVKEGSAKPLTLYHYQDGETSEFSSEGCTIPAGGTAVLWCFRKDTLSGYTSFPTEEEFRAAYNIPDSVPVYVFINQNGLNNTNRSFQIYKLGESGKTLVSSYAYVGATDCKDNKSAVLSVNPEGPEMILTGANVTTSMGLVDYSQYVYVKDDGSALKLQLDDAVPTSVMQNEEIRVNFYFEQTGALPRTGITTYYRFDGEGKWYSNTEASRRVPDLYEVLISADEIFSHDYVEFYVSADNRYRSTLSPIYRVDINKLGDVSGIRTNIAEGEKVSGVVTVTANDGSDNANSEIYIDGVKQDTVPCLEDGAYFTFHADGRDSYFKNAVTTTEDEIIAPIGKWQYTILDGQAIQIDNSYFKYNAATDSYDVTLRFWAGTYGATVDEYLMPDANREDFTVTELALRLINGRTYYPTAIGPDDAETSAKTNLSTDYTAVHSIGDSTAMCPYMDVSFSVPASDVNAVGVQLDTTALSDGKHTVLVTNGSSRQSVSFYADNTAPVLDLGIEDKSELSGSITIDPQASDASTIDKFTAELDGEQITLPLNTTAYALGKGEHTLSVYAEDAAGNYTAKTVTITVSDAAIVLSDVGASDISDTTAKLYLKVQSNTGTQADFYKAEKIEATRISTDNKSGILPYIQYTIDVKEAGKNDQIVVNWDGKLSDTNNTRAAKMFVLNTATGEWDIIAKADAEGSVKNAAFDTENHIKDGKATVIVQCTAESALPDLDVQTDGKKDVNAGWTGDTSPEDYDFCFAWETDTQYYAEEWQHHFLNMNQWIVDNAEEMKIKYTIHTGDIVDDCDMIYEWENADEAMKILDDAGMPYGVLGGNHDVAAGLADYENYFTYFGEERFASQPTYGGSYKNNTGHYDLISEGGQDFIIVYMSWNIYQEEIDWMNKVIQQYSDRKAILCFHTYANVKYSSDTLLDYYGQLIQKEVVAKNPNVFAVLNGHYHGSSYETAMFDDNGDGVKERTVYQICTDYQSGFEGGSEYIKFLYFDLDNNKIYMNSYSPCLDDYNFYDDTEVAKLNVEGASDIAIDKMILDVSFNTSEQSILENSFSAYIYTGEKIGTAKVENGAAVLNLDGLDAETDYMWYAVVTNEDAGILLTKAYEFTTVKAAEAPNENEDNNSTTSEDNSSTTSEDNSSTTSEDNNSTTSEDNSSTTPEDNNSTTSEDNSSTTSEDNSTNPDTGVKAVTIPLALIGISALGACAVLTVYSRRGGRKTK